ncbi:MAG: phosphate uptake regulator PhoU [archaeon]|nr:phosphate uptake regulator PhoU [archaeon]
MEIRRIQITGGSSFMVTLPKDWAEARGLKKNDPVVVTPQSDGSLLLSPQGLQVARESTKTISLDDLETADSLYRCLIGAYIAGHDQIVLRSEGPILGTFLEAISEFTQTSMGMEIVEEDEDQIVIKDLIDHSEVIPQKNVRREYLLVKRMIADVLAHTRPKVSDMAARDTEVDRIHWLVQRQASIHQQDIGLCSRMGLRLGAVTSCVGVSKILERLGDHAVMVLRNLEHLGESDRSLVETHLESLGPIVLAYLGDAMGSWLDADYRRAESVIRRKEEVLVMIGRRFAGLSVVSNLGLLLGSMTRIVEYCSDIAESAINISME